MDRKDKLMKILGGLARLLIADICCAMILMPYMFIYGKGIVVSFLTGLCTTGVVCGLLADYCLKFSSKVKDNVKYKGKPDSPNFGPLFFLFNTYFVPIVDIPIHGSIGNPEAYNVWAVVLMFFMQISIPITTAVTYRIGYYNVDVTEKIMYKGRDDV